MYVCITDTYSPLKNKAESEIIVIKVKPKRRIVQRNISKRVWGFVMFWEAGIYSHTAVKDGHPDLEN